jgi:hypothetical protein
VPFIPARPIAGRIDIMAGFQVGVNTEADVNSQPGPQSKSSLMLQDAGTWSYIWLALAFAYLIGIYIGMIRISRRG